MRTEKGEWIKMKEYYNTPELEIDFLLDTDIVTLSDGGTGEGGEEYLDD